MGFLAKEETSQGQGEAKFREQKKKSCLRAGDDKLFS
jgi:hypothetical protein